MPRPFGRVEPQKKAFLLPAGCPPRKLPVAFDIAKNEARRHNHEVCFYSDDAAYVETVANFLAGALRAGSAAITMTTKPHRDLLWRALKLQGVDVDAAAERGALISLDAAEVLSSLMVNGWPDRVRFFAAFGNMIGVASSAA